MKKTLKFILRFFILLATGVVVFFFWGSSTNLEPEMYTKINTYENSITIDNDSVFSILTYNVGYLSGMTNNRTIEKPEALFIDNMTALKSKLTLVNPDIIAFQEIDFDSDRSFNLDQSSEISKLGFTNEAQTVNWDKRYVPFPYGLPSIHFGKLLSGQSIVSKYPISNHKIHTLKRVESMSFLKDAFYLERLAQVASVTINGTQVYLINVHLEAFDKPTRAKQMTTVNALFKKYSSKYPTIMLGDFNSNPENKDAAVLELINDPAIGCADYNPDEVNYTFDSRNPYKRIDFIFYNKSRVQEIDSRVLTEFGEISDHLPIEMRFKLKI
jgi:endonuclease/exonuclease/phosphatase family metal-dependent hydrolase